MTWEVTRLTDDSTAQTWLDLSKLTLGDVVCRATLKSAQHIMSLGECYQLSNGDRKALIIMRLHNWDDEDYWWLNQCIYDPADWKDLEAEVVAFLANWALTHKEGMFFFAYPGFPRTKVYEDLGKGLSQVKGLKCRTPEQKRLAVWEVSHGN